MRIFLIRLLFTLNLFSCIMTVQAQQQPAPVIYTVAQLQEDFTVLRNKLERSLANLYLYTPKTKLDQVFDSLYRSLKPMTEQEFFCHITYVQSYVKDGHSNIYPSEKSRNERDAQAGFFPYQVNWDGSKLIMIRDQSAEKALPAGTEFISFNGMPANELMGYMLDRIVRDGPNLSYPVWILNSYFRSYYSFFFGNPEQFRIRYRLPDGNTGETDVRALTRAEIKKNNEERYPVTNQIAGISADTIFNKKWGLLRIKSWDASLLRTQYHQRFKQETDAAFRKFNETGITHLVIDLRDNQGGDAENGIYLAAQLLSDPFTYVRSVDAVKEHADTGQVLDGRRDAMTGIKTPAEKIFSGKLFILTNGGSFSNSGIFCSLMKAQQRALIIGTETGGNSHYITGDFGAGGAVTLPNTGLVCDKTNFRISFGDPATFDGRGVIPDHIVPTTAADIISGRDPVLEFIRTKLLQTP